MRAVQVDDVRGARAGGGDVGPSVAVEIAEGQAVDRSCGIAEARRPEPAAVVPEDHPRSVPVACHQVQVAVGVEVGRGQRIDPIGRIADGPALTEATLAEIPEQAGAASEFIPGHDVEPPVAVEVVGRHRPGGGARRPDRNRCAEVSGAAVQEERALASVAVRHEEIGPAVPVQVSRRNRGGRLR